MVHRFAPGQKLNVGIVGATGLVGSMIREILAERNFPLAQLRLFASARSAGKVLDGVTIEDAATADYAGLDIVLFSAGGSTSKNSPPRWLRPVRL
jgi:aspartate-semialdehyde dehydrogenase